MPTWYFKVTGVLLLLLFGKSKELIDKSKDPDHTRNSLFSEYNHLSRRQLKKVLKELKSNTDVDNSTRIRYVSKLIRIKYRKKGSRLRTEMTNDEKIEKDFWKFCKEVFENEKQVLPDFVEKTCSDYFIKSLKKNKHLRDFSPP